MTPAQPSFSELAPETSGPNWRKYFSFSTDHKVIGIQYLVTSFVFYMIGGALAELVRTMKHCRENDGELYLRNPSDPVRVILELTQLDAAFAVVDVTG